MHYFIAILAPIFWGSTYSAVALYLGDLSPYWMAVWRALPAGILMLLISRRGLPLSLPRMLAVSFFNIAAFFLLLFIAAYRLPGAVAGTLGATLPLVLMLLQWLTEGKRPEPKLLSLALLGLFGVGLLLNPSTDIDWLGAGAMLLATFFVAQSTLWMKRWAAKDIFGLTAWQLVLGGAMLIPFAWILAGPPQAPTLHAVPGLIWVIVLNTAVGYWAYIRSITVLGPNRQSIIMFLNPLTAVTLGVLWIEETLQPLQWLGIAMILASLLWMKFSDKLTLPRSAKTAVAPSR
ncbi:EamA family transporter [Salinivibrio kushneri]|uniref:EamA family transporter n=1 Tax=Salinivibrio kushneri TaxID=1908198 RepID=A0AA47LSQ7_9GAMM|nr:EamA family transporter [Salinivibrio kushneri]WBA10084.1 EamA family transporter [Salinivibrio kushneri]